MSMRRIVVLSALVLAACGRAAGGEPTEEPVKKIEVQTAVVGKKAVPQEVTLTGVLTANARTDLSANANGRVMRVFVELGQRVVAGAPIVQLDSRSALLAEREANANVKTALEQLAASKKDCERYQKLMERGAITQQEYDRATGQCQIQTATEAAARVRVEQASQSVADSTVRAPFAGKIADKMINVGDYVRADSKVVTLLSDDPLRLRLTVPERDIAAVKPGLAVRFETPSVPDRTFTAQLKYIGGEVRERTRDLVVEALVENQDGALMPGTFVTAHLSTGTAELPVIPKSALVTGQATPSVFIVDGDRARQRILQLGPAVGEELAVLDGLQGNEHVVLNPANTLSDGALVD